MLYRFNVAGSEYYNTALEAELTTALGVSFSERPDDSGKRPVREITGVDPRLNQEWSSRAAAITRSASELQSRFLADHGRVPTTVEMISLRQRANLSTRQAKHEPRSLNEQRAAWHDQAVQVLGDDRALNDMIANVLCRRVGTGCGGGCFVAGGPHHPDRARRWRRIGRSGGNPTCTPRRCGWSAAGSPTPVRRCGSRRRSPAAQSPGSTRRRSGWTPRSPRSGPPNCPGPTVSRCTGWRRPSSTPHPRCWPRRPGSSPPPDAPTAAGSGPRMWSWRSWNGPPTPAGGC